MQFFISIAALGIIGVIFTGCFVFLRRVERDIVFPIRYGAEPPATLQRRDDVTPVDRSPQR